MTVDLEGLDFALKVAKKKWDTAQSSYADDWLINNAEAIKKLAERQGKQCSHNSTRVYLKGDTVAHECLSCGEDMKGKTK